MHIHVFEFIGGGGLVGTELPPSLAREGDLMCGAVVGDLAELPGLQVSYSRDARLGPLASVRPGAPLAAARVFRREPGEPNDVALAREIAQAQAIWPIAPETGGALLRAAQSVLDGGRLLLGSEPCAIAVAAGKRATAECLLLAGVPCVPTFAAGDEVPALPGAWVVKPDDGAGCQDTTVWPDHGAAVAALAAGRGSVAQPWIEGDAMSLSVVAGPGIASGVEVLSVNRQRLRLKRGRLEIHALEVNVAAVSSECQQLAVEVVRAMPGLAGFFGIDFVSTVQGPVVIEVNPRVTTACAGLREALGINVAARVLAATGWWTAGDAMVSPAHASHASHAAHTVRLELETIAHG